MKYIFAWSIMIGSSISVFAQNEITQPWDLTGCIEYAVSHNITVKQTELNEEAAVIGYQQSKATLFPTISASASQSLNKGTSADPITYEFVSRTINSTSLGVNAQVTLYNGNKVKNTIRQNDLLVDQNSLFVQEAKNNITLSVTQAYLQALYNKESITIAESNLNASEKQWERTKALYEAGSVAAKDLADIKSQYASDQYTLVTAKNSYEQQVLSLKQLLELEPGQSFEPEFPSDSETVEIAIPDKYEVYKKSLAILPEIKAQQLQRDVETLDLKIARAGYQPTLSLTGGMSTGYTNTQQSPFQDQLNNNFNQYLGVTLSIPIFSNLRTKSSVQTARIAIRTAELNLLAEKKELYQKIENAHQNAVAAQGELEAVSAEVAASKEAFGLTQQQFNLGLVNTVDLLVNQNNYLTALQKYNQTKYTGLLYYQLLQFYQGNPIKL